MVFFDAVETMSTFTRNGIPATPENMERVKNIINSVEDLEADPIYDMQSFIYDDMGRDDYTAVAKQLFFANNLTV